MSSQAAHQDEPPPLEEEDSRNSLLDYELEGEEDAEMTGEEVVVEEPEVKKKKRRTRRGSGQERKERNERLRQGELITIAREEYDSLRKLPEEVKEMKKRLEEVERALKRASTGKESQTPAKKPKLGPPTLREKLCMHPHLINSAYFHNWWGKHSAKPIWGPRAIAELANLGIPKSSLERLDPHALSEVYCLVTSRLLEQGAIDRLPAFVPKCYANKGLTMFLVIEKITILSPVISSFILSEKRLFEVDARRAGAVALMLQSKPKNLVITKNDARHKLNSGKARGAKNLPSTSWKETDHLPRHKPISSTSHNSHTFSEEIVKTITGPPPVCSFSKKSNDPIINFNADKGVQRVVAPEEAVEIIEEDYTETGSKSDEESATCEDENLDGECGYFSTDRRVFEEELRPRIVVPLQPTILSEFDVEPDVLIKEGNAEDSQNIGESSHSSRRQMSRGRRESKSPEPRDRRHCASMSPERVSRVSTKSKISSKNSSNSKSITRRNNSLLAEVRIPGHVSEATRKARGGAPSFLKTREFSPDRAKHRQHDRHQPRDGEDRHHHRH